MIKKGMLIWLLLANTLLASAASFNILDYGAAPGKLCTPAIQKAIDACYEAGGGTVVVPAGSFITGTIFLKSRINLYLEPGAELVSSLDLADFKVNGHHYGMIFCQNAVQVSITGHGVINARGEAFYEKDRNHKASNGTGANNGFERSLTRQKENYLPDGVFFTDGPLERKPCPGMSVVFFNCNQVVIRDITLRDSPLWAFRFGYCENVVVDGITILNNLMIPNNDGIHMTVSRNVRISNCDITAGDDAIIVTGFDKIENTPGYKMTEQDKYEHGNKSIYAENIQVTNCHLQSRSSAIRIGYGQHPIRRCVFDNIIITGSNRGIGIYARDAAAIEELVFSNITIDTRLHNGIWWGHGEPIHLSSISRFKNEPVGQIKDVQFNNITATGEQGIILYGLKESHMENIRFNNIKLHIRKGAETMGYGGNFDLRPSAFPEKQIFEHDIPGLYAQYVDQLSIKDFSLTWDKDLPSFFTNGIECVTAKDVLIEGFHGTANEGAPSAKNISLEGSSVRK